MSSYLIIRDVRWYYRLKPKTENNRIKRGLFSHYPRHTLINRLIVSMSYLNPKTGRELRLYSNFKSYLEFGIYMLKFPQHERCFYEIILGESTQKPHFDLDIPFPQETLDGEKIKDNLIDSAIKVLSDLSIQLDLSKDLLIYSSHGKDKQSYHIVINNYCHNNNIEAKAFYDHVTELVIPDYVQWIDRAVYSPTQQFRMVGSQKIGTSRIKTFNSTWNHHGKNINHVYPEDPDSPEHETIMILEESMVGHTSNCYYLPGFHPKEVIKEYTDTEDVTRSEALEAVNLIAMAGNISMTDSKFPYKFLGINGPIIMLKRIRPSRCRICKRIHEHENPYLLIVGEERSVYFYCRRAPSDKKLYLGKLHPKESDVTQESDISETCDTDKINRIKIDWSRNVLDRVKKLAQENNKIKTKHISKIDPECRDKIIQMYINKK